MDSTTKYWILLFGAILILGLGYGFKKIIAVQFLGGVMFGAALLYAAFWYHSKKEEMPASST